MTVSDGSPFGATFPLIVTATRAGAVLAILEVTGRNGNVLTVSGAIEGTTDAALQAGDRLEMRPTALAITELQAAILSDEANLATHVADTSNPHNVTAAQVGASLAQWNAAELQGRPIATPAPTDGQVLVWSASAGAWTPRATAATGGLAIGGSVAGGTSGRVLYEAAGPVLAESAALTFDGANLMVSGTVTVREQPDQVTDALQIQDSSSNVLTSIAHDGTISSPGSGLNSERFGAGSTAAADHSVAIGAGASTAGSHAIAIGTLASSGAPGTYYSSAIGSTASATQIFGTAVGYGADASGAYSTAIGAQATGSAFGTAIGAQASATSSGIAIGYSASAGHTASICIGAGVNDTANYQLVIGSWANGLPITDVYIGGGVAHVNAHIYPTTYHGTGGSGTDNAGSSLVLAGGQGTGAGAGGDLVFQTAPAGATGSAPNALVERLRITQDGKVSLASPLLLPTLADSAATGGSIYLGTDHLDGQGAPKLCRKDNAGNVTVLG